MDSLRGNRGDHIAAVCQLLRLWATGDFGDQALAVEGRKSVEVLVFVDFGDCPHFEVLEVPEYFLEPMLLITSWKAIGNGNVEGVARFIRSLRELWNADVNQDGILG